MTPERAQWLLDNQLLGGDFRYAFHKQCDTNSRRIYSDGITEQEDLYLFKEWMKLPGFTSFFNVVCLIAQGKLNEKHP